MKTAANNKKIREIISLVEENKLLPRPEFQRRLIWTREDKNRFIDTILRGYPFPEIYLADGEVDLDSGKGTQLLVDGLQRVSTIIQYFNGDPNLKLTSVPEYKSLGDQEKKDFLLYDVAVRDLGNVSREEIIEVFKRINATKYSLLDIEVSNAVYNGSLKKFAERVCENSFFQNHNVFNALDYKRMGDLRFALSIIITMLIGYFNRDDAFQEALERFNDDFPHEEEIGKRISDTISFLEECGFEPSSRAWKKNDLFTLMIEIDYRLHIANLQLQPSTVVDSIQDFYSKLGKTSDDDSVIPSIYYKSAIQASNDKLNRIRRGVVIGDILDGRDFDHIKAHLISEGLISE